MPRMRLSQFLDDDFIVYNDPHQRRQGKLKPGQKRKNPAGSPAELAEQADSKESFRFSYAASRHEQGWLQDALGEFYENQWITDILRLVKGGKEATVYQCAAHPATEAGELIAAKVYRPRMFRNLKKDHIYREGRSDLDRDGLVILDDGKLHAMAKKTRYGMELLHTSWIEHEYRSLQELYAAGADVPQPFIADNNAILMAYIGGPETPAPALSELELDPNEAYSLFERVVRNIEIMLAHGCVHGDLSAFNILYWQGEITLIDFPQAMEPRQNSNVYRIFARDVERVCEYFARQGVHSRPARLAADLWTAYGHPLKAEVHPAHLDADNEQDRRYWVSRK